MKKFLFIIMLALCGSNYASAQNFLGASNVRYATRQQSATITFSNQSDYTMTLKVMHAYGGLYTIVNLPAHSRQTVSFGSSNSYRLKIKAVHYGQASYHDGGKFSVTCTESEWSEGEISFRMSTYGTGLGPSITAKEFESNN